MRNRLLFALATAIGSAMQLAPSVAQQPARATFDELKQGGFVIVIRHGRTNESPSNPKEESPTDLANCAGQFMLNDTGKAQARAIGDAFKRAGIPVGKVRSVKPSTAGLQQDVALDPVVDLSRLEFVKVLEWAPK